MYTGRCTRTCRCSDHSSPVMARAPAELPPIRLAPLGALVQFLTMTWVQGAPSTRAGPAAGVCCITVQSIHSSSLEKNIFNLTIFVTKSESNHSFQPGYMHSKAGSMLRRPGGSVRRTAPPAGAIAARACCSMGGSDASHGGSEVSDHDKAILACTTRSSRLGTYAIIGGRENIPTAQPPRRRDRRAAQI